MHFWNASRITLFWRQFPLTELVLINGSSLTLNNVLIHINHNHSAVPYSLEKAKTRFLKTILRYNNSCKSVTDTTFSLLGRESYIANPKRLNLWTLVSYWHSPLNGTTVLINSLSLLPLNNFMLYHSPSALEIKTK